ncbi:hypothetical protein D9V86_07320 [Bacteroidetes/Chlorobi group bacterium ChocPot_Mid]|nr:MAG: hypothetical protein D9V86_07320 [Bacteroidetes/Chlorobi group bacterium ChocPot_Mid]
MRISKIEILVIITFAIFTGCKQYDNFTTYFNTYYNMERLLKESEEEFSFQEEKKRIRPRVIVPEAKIKLPEPRERGLPPFLEEFIINKQQRQAVSVKLDSIIIKGSKILAKHPKSDYIQETLYLMAVSYFYQNIWLNSQIKCSELIDRYPEGKLSPDAHILLAKNLLIQRKFEAGKMVLSRTVDVAWLLKRYDILSEAFRIEAELALFNKDYEEAIRPYKQAIIQSDDDEMKAKWQFDMAALLFRISRFEQAEKQFRKVKDFKPSYITEFEAELFRASSLARMGKFEEAEKILGNLESDGKFEEWKASVFAERMNVMRLKDSLEQFKTAEKYSDTTYVGSDAIAGVYYERGLDYFSKQDYSNARMYLGKSRNVASPVSKKASQVYKLLEQWNTKKTAISSAMKKYNESKSIADTERMELAKNMYEMARVQEQLGNLDSAEYYYSSSTTITVAMEEASARYYYAYARFLNERKPVMSDSLMEIIVERYPLTDYGQDAMRRLGYTENYVIDTLKELYNSGIHLWQSKEYEFAIAQFSKLFNYYPMSELAPKSIYTIGWIYENDLGLYKKAIEYYKLLERLYPESIYSKDVRRSIEYATLVATGKPIPDSLKTKERKRYYAPIAPLLEFPEKEEEAKKTEKKKRKDNIDGKDLLSDPTKLFKDMLESIPSTDELLEEPGNMLETITKPDSLKNLLPGVNLPDPLKDLKKSEEKKEKQEGEKGEPKKEEPKRDELILRQAQDD